MKFLDYLEANLALFLLAITQLVAVVVLGAKIPVAYLLNAMSMALNLLSDVQLLLASMAWPPTIPTPPKDPPMSETGMDNKP